MSLPGTIHIPRLHQNFTARILQSLGGSPDLVVMGGDSCSKGRVFESQHHVLDGHVYTFNFNVCLNRRK